MKKQTNWLVIAMFVGLFMIAGCGEQSGLKGKILDSKSHPISKLKVIAKQVNPIIKGYEQFETTTSPEGTFEFTKLYPSSDYVISVYHTNWSTNAEARVTTGEKGKTTTLLYPIQIFIAVNAEGYQMDPQTNKPRCVVTTEGAISVITDLFFEREWVLGPDVDTTYDEAKAWCANLSVAGGGWRMPQREELRISYITGLGEEDIRPAFKTTGSFVWSGEKFDAKSDWGLPLSSGDHHGGRAFAVRSLKR